MLTIKMNANGQFVLPKAVREHLKIFPGCRVNVMVDEKRRLVLTPAWHEPEALFADRPPVKRVVSVDEMNDAIGEAMRARV